ncbi:MULTISPECIES: hypothetical protein [Streptomyces]|uniref:Uncharacterized protein n=1 Tax=Streptomyces ehimensis TaxID=68195 RepID=A0ABV9BEZ4_9ACTN
MPYEAPLIVIKRPDRHVYYVDELLLSEAEASSLEADLNDENENL